MADALQCVVSKAKLGIAGKCIVRQIVGLQVYVGEVATFHECTVTHRNAFSINYYALQCFAVGKGVIANTFHGGR